MVASAAGSTTVKADFHNHSCLSPCAELTMSPAGMARTARERGISVFALTDHNASLNCPAFALACAREGVIPLFGMEMNPLEEAHLLAIFASPRQALEFGCRVESLLPDIPWTTERFGDQPVVDSEERILQGYPKWLGSALHMGFDALAGFARDTGAMVIPAHVDRASFSVFSQLGFLPEGPYSAVEAVGNPSAALTGKFHIVRNSDAHDLDQIGCRNFWLDIPGILVDEMRQALGVYAARLQSSAEEAAGGGSVGDYAELLNYPEVRFYPEREAAALFEAIRTALETGRISLHPGK